MTIMRTLVGLGFVITGVFFLSGTVVEYANPSTSGIPFVPSIEAFAVVMIIESGIIGLGSWLIFSGTKSRDLDKS